jgi:hypothetical protein
MTSMRILQLNVMILRNERKFPILLWSVVRGQDHSFFKDLTGVFCTVGGTLEIIIDTSRFREDGTTPYCHDLHKIRCPLTQELRV